MKEHLKTGLILAVFMLASGLLVSIVYNFVSPYLEQGDISNTLKAIEEVLKDPTSGSLIISSIPKDKKSLDEAVWKDSPDGVLYTSTKGAKVYSPSYMFKEGSKEIYVLTVSGLGFGGEVKSILSLVKENNELKLNKIEVLDYSGETPGLGAKIAQDSVKSRFYNIPQEGLISGIRVDKDAKASISTEEIDSYKEQGIVKTSDIMTGATITARAVADSINAAVEFLNQEGVLKAELKEVSVEPSDVQEEIDWNVILQAIDKILIDSETGEYLVSDVPTDLDSLESAIWKENSDGVLYTSSKGAKVYSPSYKFTEDAREIYVLNIAGKGFGGEVKSIISFVKENNELRLNKIEVLDYSGETPGLGAKIAEDKVKERFYSIPYSGLSSGVKVDKDAGVTVSSEEIENYKKQGVVKTSDVMTSATITARSVADSINAAVEFLKQEGVIE
ncbi:MAG: FMN-binding protein [Defluviitoga tunisiensis]|nr:FMN-binding protein [Defluviitoga tunisiensis]